MKKEILYFGKMDLPFNNASACRVMGICSSLKKSGFDCFTYGYTKGKTFNGNADNINFENDRYPNKLLSYLFTFGNNKRIKKVLKKHNVENIKAIFFTSLGHGQIKYLGKWCRKHQIPLINDRGDIIRSSHKNFLFKPISSKEYKLFEKAVRKYASVMSISTFINNYVEKQGINSFIVPCIANNESVRFNVEASKNVDDSKINIGYFGDPGKDFYKDRLDWCLDAFAKLNNPNISFYVGGVNLNQIPEKYRDNKHFIFLGKLSNKECISYIKSLDFTVLFRENTEIANAGFASKITESFACGVPVLSNITGDLKHYLNNNNSITSEGFDKESCYLLFEKLNLVTKNSVSNLKKYIYKNNQLLSDKWSKTLTTNINEIEERIKQ